AQKAIQLAPKVADPHLWKGDSLRLTGKYEEARAEYLQYLSLSNFDSGVAGQLNYHVLGWLFGMGKRTHASTKDIWSDMRSLAYFGICDSERKLGAWGKAIPYCQKALTYDPKDPFIHYGLGLAYMSQAIDNNDTGGLVPAEKHLQ